MTLSRNLLAAVGVAGMIAAGAAIPAIAQDATDDTATSDDSLEPEAHELRRAARAEAFADALAAELGLEADTVAEAIEAVHEEMQSALQDEIQARVQARLDELVEAGELTQEEADILAEVQGRGVLGGGLGNHGPGIRDEDLPRIFDRFYRAAEARGAPGSGLGLSIVAQVAAAHGGRVTAANVPGGGAVFRLHLPTTIGASGA